MESIEGQFPYPRHQHCKILHLVRHGQALHNVEGDKNPEALLSPNLFDAQLTPLGLKQVAKLRNEVHASGLFNRIELVVTSPLSRAMETASGCFGREGENAVSSSTPKIMAVELCRDRLGVRPCDMRRKMSDCRSRFPWIDFSMMDVEDDNLWNPELRESEEELAKRVIKLLNCFDNCELRSVVLDTSKIERERWAWLCSDDKAKDVLKQCGHHSIDVATCIYLKSSLVA
ncbi:hypothetical protein ERO13_D13G136150v2 [Gossypium hirsutum]|uniref:Phosphoglycerate mutase-like protein 1 isoform X2 n=1 Tax=Gossypium hirsutum TaxID=3635 RepID=A0ABM3BD13_GOSHI|nr:phosphoglycerate mutase-like protein 1 isoform X2 [Gossypium hirsutum]KAG4112003.1 hypothetical protein ERO13_D13G136150v2 [Gossypium hirsutum]